MNESEGLGMLSRAKAVIKNSHVVYTSGKHGSSYVNKDAVYPLTDMTSLLCQEMASRFLNDRVQVVVGPALGGIILSQWTAYHLSKVRGLATLGVYAEKDNGGNFVIKRGYDKLLAGRRVLVVEDVLTTGGSAKKVIEAVRQHGGNVLGLSVLCNRGGITPEMVANPPRLEALVSLTLEAWDEKDCPLCAAHIPINTDVGKGREFLAKKRRVL